MYMVCMYIYGLKIVVIPCAIHLVCIALIRKHMQRFLPLYVFVCCFLWGLVLGPCFVIWFLAFFSTTVKPVLSGHSKIRRAIGFQDRLSLNAGQKYCRMLQWDHSAILSTFINVPFVIKIFALSSFEWPLKTVFTVFSIILLRERERGDRE